MPKTIGNYEIIEKVGQGGMGAVFKARQISMDRVVALKILPPKLAEDEQYLQRFFREARSAGQCSHANLISVYDFGEVEGYYCFSMEFVDGPSLKRILKERGPLDENTALDYMLKISQALQVAHGKGIVHRDVKPDNVLVGSDGEPKLADLGLAKPMSGDADVTMGGRSIGTPAYMSPEQSQGKPCDGRADLYSLAATFFHLLTGEPLFTAPTSAAIMVMQVTDKPRRIKEVRPDISSGLDSIIAKLLQKKPEKRYKDAAQLIEDLQAMQHGGVPRHAAPRHARARGGPAAEESPVPHRGTRAKKPGPSPLLIGGIIGAVALVAIIAFFALKKPKPKPPPVAPPPIEVDVPPDEPPPPPPVDKDKKEHAEEMLAYAREHLGDNPTDFVKTLEYLADALKASEGTVLKFEVEKEIAAVKERQLGWAQEQWLPVATKAQAALTAKDYDGALAASQAIDPAWQPFVAEAQAALQQKIKLAGEAAVNAILDDAATKLKADDFAGCEAALASIPDVKWQPGVTAAQPKIAELTRAMDKRKIELADAATAAWRKVRQELFDLLIAKKLDECAKRVKELKSDPANASAREQLDEVAAIVKAYKGYDEWVLATVKGKVGAEADLADPGEPERPGKLDKVAIYPRTGKLSLCWKIELEIDGVKGSTTEWMPFDEIPSRILDPWIKDWQPKTSADRFMVLVDTLAREQEKQAAPMVAALDEHPLHPPAAAKLRELEIGAENVLAEQAFAKRIEPLLADTKEWSEQQGKDVEAAVTAFATEFAGRQVLVERKADLDGLLARAKEAQLVNLLADGGWEELGTLAKYRKGGYGSEHVYDSDPIARRSGERGLRLGKTGEGDLHLGFTPAVFAALPEPGKTYTFTFWACLVEEEAVTLEVQIAGGPTTTFTPTKEWQQYTYVFTVRNMVQEKGWGGIRPRGNGRVNLDDFCFSAMKPYRNELVLVNTTTMNLFNRATETFTVTFLQGQRTVAKVDGRLERADGRWTTPLPDKPFDRVALQLKTHYQKGFALNEVMLFDAEGRSRLFGVVPQCAGGNQRDLANLTDNQMTGHRTRWESGSEPCTITFVVPPPGETAPANTPTREQLVAGQWHFRGGPLVLKADGSLTCKDPRFYGWRVGGGGLLNLLYKKPNGENSTHKFAWDGQKWVDTKDSRLQVTGTPGGEGGAAVPAGESRYQYVAKPMSWTAAQAWCEKQGGHLVTITSVEERAAVTALTKDRLIHVGARLADGKPVWITGEAAPGMKLILVGEGKDGNGLSLIIFAADARLVKFRPAAGGLPFVCELPAPAGGADAGDPGQPGTVAHLLANSWHGHDGSVYVFKSDGRVKRKGGGEAIGSWRFDGKILKITTRDKGLAGDYIWAEDRWHEGRKFFRKR